MVQSLKCCDSNNRDEDISLNLTYVNNDTFFISEIQTQIKITHNNSNNDNNKIWLLYISFLAQTLSDPKEMHGNQRKTWCYSDAHITLKSARISKTVLVTI